MGMSEITKENVFLISNKYIATKKEWGNLEKTFIKSRKTYNPPYLWSPMVSYFRLVAM